MKKTPFLPRVMRSTMPGLVLGIAVGSASLLLVSGKSHAQGQEASGGLEEVMVTARKREEGLLEVPVSIQALSASDIQSTNLRNLEDVASFTAGLNFQKLGNSQGGRYNSVIRFRGLEMLITGPSTQTGSLFVDGVRVLGGAASFNFSDIERIEVIRGPQAAYFGRGTFGGAINYVTAEPASQFGGRASAEYSPTFGSNAYNLMVNGPLTETLAGRLSLSSRTRGAMFTANDGGSLGEETTDQLNVMLRWQPNDALRAKFNYVYAEDKDGPAATTFVPYRLHGNCPIGTPYEVKTTAGPYLGTIATTDLHCGELPIVQVSNNTVFYTVPTTLGDMNARDILVDHEATLGVPATGTPHLEAFGLKSIAQLYSLAVDYDLSDSLTLAALVGYNKRSTTQIRDDDMYDTLGRLTKGFVDLEALSGELRLNFDNNGRLRAMIGGSYGLQKEKGDIDGGIGLLTNAFGPPLIGPSRNGANDNDIDNYGFFGSFEYDFTDWFTMSLEGRYQVDKLTVRSGTHPGPYVAAPEEEYSDFLPRVLATFRPFAGTTVYGSFAEGVLPGTVNASVSALSPNELAVLEEMIPGLSPIIPSQTLDSYEIGWKQRLDRVNAWFSLSAYFMEWSNIPAPAQASFISPDDGRVVTTAVSVPGDAEVKGFEFETQWSPIPQLDLRASVGYADATYTDFQSSRYNRTFSLPAGTSYKADGNRLPRTPKETAALSGTWTSDLGTDWQWYTRGDVLYMGDSYTDETGMSYLPDYTTVNFRFGFTRDSDGFNMELFCTNCLNESGWRTGRRGVDYFDSTPVPNTFTVIGAIVGPIEPREYGLRFNYEF